MNNSLIWFGESDYSDEKIVELTEIASEISIYGVLLGIGNKKYKNLTKVIHRGKDTKSRIMVRGVVMGAAQIDFEGMLRVEKGAKGTDTYFDARFMVLGDKAGAHTFPGLEIEENDIAKAGHAATVSRVREEDLFYLMSRGIGQEVAQGMMIRGFFEPVIQMMDEEERDKVRFELEEKLGGMMRE